VGLPEWTDMSKERAVRRAAREAEALAARNARARTVARRAKRREIKRKLTPTLSRRGRVGKMFPRRSTGERTIIALAFAVGVFAIWDLFDDLATRIALTAILVLALPAVVVIAFGRRSG
jgi:hypothetical protein